MQITVTAVGDIMMGDAPMRIGHGVASKVKVKGSAFLFQSVAPVLRTGDVVVGNLEAVLSDAGLDSESLSSAQLRAGIESVEGLKHAGFNMLSLANNHALDHGQEAFKETVRLLSENDIVPVGTARSGDAFRRTVHVSKGLSIAVLAYCSIPSPNGLQIPVDWPDRLVEAVRNAGDEADVVMVSLHWGEEYVQFPSPFQIRLGRRLVDSGAHLVLGHHPHVLQGMEEYGGGLICYSLGNFVFDQWQSAMRESVILRCGLSPNGVAGFELEPVFIDDEYAPQVLSGVPRQEALARFRRLSEEITQEDLSDFEAKSRRYQAVAADCQAHRRRQLWAYFARNLLRYRPEMTWQLARTGLTRLWRQRV